MTQFHLINSREQKINIIEGNDIKPKALLIHLHGIGSHFQKMIDVQDDFEYKDLFFNSFEIKSYGLEFHGHGLSEGKRCCIDKFDYLVDDLKTLLIYLKKYNIPKFILAESMAGAVAIKFEIEYKKDFPIDGYILCSPMCGISKSMHPNELQKWFLLNLSKLFPEIKLLGSNKHIEETCKNKQYLQAKQLCPYSYRGKMRLNTARECYNTCLWIENNSHLFNSPIFLLHGIDDKITDPKMSIKFFNSIKNNNKKIYLPRNTNHSLFIGIDDNDIHPNLVLDMICKWLNSSI